ncbi:MAG: YlmC/YmxH family sporulation protein [Clostridia bacterium]|nr:YlmC/YmxH family sporulation protein [Clostridia bacterium]
MEISFSELREKSVVNLIDGRRLGHIIDIVIEQCSAKILGVVVPGVKTNLFRTREDIFIPYKCIVKIGLDTILVELNPMSNLSKNSVNLLEEKISPSGKIS